LLLWLADITVKEEDAGMEKMMLIIGRYDHRCWYCNLKRRKTAQKV
jgi:hypothetical protein